MSRPPCHVKRPFAYVADFSRQAKWDSNTVSSKRIDDGDLGVGARFALNVKMGTRTRRWSTASPSIQAPSRVVLIGEGSGVWSQDIITFSDDPEGTRVDYVAEESNSPVSWVPSSRSLAVPSRASPGAP